MYSVYAFCSRRDCNCDDGHSTRSVRIGEDMGLVEAYAAAQSTRIPGYSSVVVRQSDGAEIYARQA